MSSPYRPLAFPLSILAAIAVSHCGDGRPTDLQLEDQELPPPSATFDIQDAASGGNAHLHWLPPMVHIPTYSGVFDGSLEPVVEVCEWEATVCITPLVAAFTMTSGTGSETIRVVPEDEHYIVNWHSAETARDLRNSRPIRPARCVASARSAGAGWRPIRTSRPTSVGATGGHGHAQGAQTRCRETSEVSRPATADQDQRTAEDEGTTAGR